MAASGIAASLFTVIIGTIAGCLVPEAWLPYAKMVHLLSSYSTIYFTLSADLANQKKKRRSSELWNSYCLIRDYFLISALRGIISQALDHLATGRLEEFSLQTAMINDGQYLKEAAFCIILIISFQSFVETVIGQTLISITSVFVRAKRSINIFKSYPSSGALTTLIEMGKVNILNSAATTVTLTLIELLFKGRFTLLSQWLGLRLVYFITPLIQTTFQSSNLASFQIHFLNLIQNSTKGFGIDFTEQLADGLFMMTLFLFLSSTFIITPAIKSLLNSLY